MFQDAFAGFRDRGEDSVKEKVLLRLYVCHIWPGFFVGSLLWTVQIDYVRGVVPLLVPRLGP